VARIYDRPKGTANGRYLIAAHDIDLNDRDTLSEITTINPTLENALAGGIVGALIAALPGFIDLTDLQNPKTITIAIWHMTINLLAVALYCVNFWLRMHRAPGDNLPIVLSVIGIVLIISSGWLGGELVLRARRGCETAARSKHLTERRLKAKL
jgi:Predicted membrane protein (DUF2231)